MRFLELAVKKEGSTTYTVPKLMMFDYEKISSPIQGVGSTATAVSKFEYAGKHPAQEFVVAEGFDEIQGLVDSTSANLYVSSLFTNGTLTASTTQSQAGALALTDYFNKVSTCANANDAVKLPTAVADKVVIITNDGAAACAVWPATGDQIESAAVDAVGAVTIAVGGKAVYWAKDATTWKLISPITY